MSTPSVPSASPTTASSSAHDAVALLERIDQRLAHVESTLARFEALEHVLPSALAGAVDTFDDVVDHLRDRGIDVDERLRTLVKISERLTSPEALQALSALVDKLSLLERVLESDIFTEASIDVVAKGGHALAAARIEGSPEVGLWRAARATSDEDVRRALGFLVRVTQLFGRSLADGGRARHLPEAPEAQPPSDDGKEHDDQNGERA